MIEIGDKAPDLSLRDANGQPLALSALWKRNPTVLAFLRHAG